MSDFTMPSLGADMDEGTLLEWLVAPGDTVHKGDTVAVVDTAKAAVEVETFSDGVVDELLVEPGTTVPVGAVLATMNPVGAPVKQRAGTAAPKPPAPRERKPAPHPAPQPPPHPAVVHSPLARQAAQRLGVDLTQVHGTGPDGSITREDVTRAAGRRATPADGRVRATPYARRLAAELGVDLLALRRADGEPVRAADVRAAAGETTPPAVAEPVQPRPSAPLPARDPAKMRAAVAALMSRAKREIPHYYLTTSVDLGPAMAWMRQRNLELPVSRRLLPAALLLKATALAAAEVPELNGYWVDDHFAPAAQVALGIAVSLRGGGLVAPALHHADDLAVDELMAEMRDLVTRARSGRLTGREMEDPSITVTNLGDQGVEAVFGVIYPPQVALVGFGKVVDRPCAVDGLLGVRPTTTLTLSADHRATDGFVGARFLRTIEDHLQRPETL